MNKYLAFLLIIAILCNANVIQLSGEIMASLSIRLNDTEKAFIEDFAKMNNKSVSELVRETVFKSLEDEYDLIELQQAVKEFKQNAQTYSLEETWEILGV